MAKAKTMGEEEIKALVAREISLAQDKRVARSKDHEKALRYYRGDMSEYLPAEEGRSRAVSRDLADTVGWILPGIMRVYTASEHMAVCEPVGPEDDQWAKAATDGVNYVFWKENDGYRVIYDATWDSLVVRNGVVKTWWDDTPKYKVSFHSGLTEEEYSILVGGDDVEVVQLTEKSETVTDPETGQPMDVSMFDCKIKRKVAGGQVRVETIPPEDFGISDEATTTAEARFKYHRCDKTRSDLIEMGFDKDVVMSLGLASTEETNETFARDEYEQTDEVDPSMEIVDYYECYMRVDHDGDGIAELLKICYAGDSGGGVVLEWEEWEDEDPFDDIPCNPMPHRWEATSISDETMDVQEIKTALIRGGLDNTYATNNPQRFVKGKILNPDQLFSPSFGGAIFGEANSEVVNLAVPYMAQHTMAAIAYQDQVIERRTGVSRSTMALDPEALQNQTATSVQASRDAAYSQIELIARNQAELGWKKVFRKILKLEIKHQDKARQIRMRGKFTEVDPRHWNADMDITINVGLGTGSRDRDMAMLQSVLQNQWLLTDKLAGAGVMDKAVAMLPYIVTTLNKQAEAAGIRNPETFYPEVTQETVQSIMQTMAQKAQQPDPKVQAEMAKTQAQMQGDQAKAQMQMQVESTKAAQQMEIERAKVAEEAKLKREQMMLDAEMKREQVVAEMGLKREQLAAEIQLKRELGMLNAQVTAATSQVHMGGDPG